MAWGVENMKITFCFEGIPRNIVGGRKVVYDYANWFSKREHDVTILYSLNLLYRKYGTVPKIFIWLISCLLCRYYPRWIHLDKRIKTKVLYKWANPYIPNGDIFVGAGSTLTQYINCLDTKKGKAVNFVQDYENWELSDKEVCDTYRLNMCHITISKYLYQLVCQFANVHNVYYVPNGINVEIYKLKVPIEKRNPRSIITLYHESNRKGVKYALEAIDNLIIKYPDIQVNMFGTPRRPEKMNARINYIQNATPNQVCDLYNKSAISLCASLQEGFGLTGMESMACGCALITTNTGGVNDYAKDGETALFVETKSAKDIVEKISYLFEHNEERISLAERGRENIVSNFSFEKSAQILENILLGTSGNDNNGNIDNYNACRNRRTQKLRTN